MAETPELKRIAENTKIQSNVSKSIASSSPGSLQCTDGYEPMVQTKTGAC
jgi:hypothetical protein